MRKSTALKILLFSVPLLFVLISAWKTVAELFMLFLLSASLAYLLLPAVKKIECRLKTSYSILLVYLIIAAVITITGFIVVPVVKSELKNIVDVLPGYFNELESKINEYTEKLPFLRKATEEFDLENMAYSFLSGKISGILSDNTVVILENALLVPVVTFYLLNERKKISSAMLFIIPEKIRQKVKTLFCNINYMLRDYLNGVFAVVLIVSGLMASVLLIFGFKNWLVLGLVMGILNVIPYIGPFLGSIPILISAAAISLNKVWLALALILAVQQVDNLIVQPYVISESVKMHPLTVLVCVLAGSGIGSLPGMLLAIPGFIILRIIIKAFYEAFTERKLNFQRELKI